MKDEEIEDLFGDKKHTLLRKGVFFLFHANIKLQVKYYVKTIFFFKLIKSLSCLIVKTMVLIHFMLFHVNINL